MCKPKTEAYFLDFDGVVVDSAHIKTDAFYDIFLPFGRKVAEFAQSHHVKNQGITRYKKFDDIYQYFWDRKCTEEEKKHLSCEFSGLVLNRIIAAPLIKGVQDFLQQQKNKGVPVYLMSATPQAELDEICRRKNINIFFRAVFGAPCSKTEAGEAVIQNEGFNVSRIIFVGDSVSDYNAAKTLGTQFVGRVDAHGYNPFPSDVSIIQDFSVWLD